MGWGGFEISFCVCGRGVDRVCLGGFVKISFMSTNSYVYKLVNFFCICHLILEKLYYHGLRLKCYGLVSTVSCIFWTICLPSLQVSIMCAGCYVQ